MDVDRRWPLQTAADLMMRRSAPMFLMVAVAALPDQGREEAAQDSLGLVE